MEPSSDIPEYLIVVDRSRPDLYAYLLRRLVDDARATIVLDRRQPDRAPDEQRPGVGRPWVERRQAPDLQQGLRRNGLAMVRLRSTRPSSVFARPSPARKRAPDHDRGAHERSHAAPPDDGVERQVAPDAPNAEDVQARLIGWVEHGQELMRRLANRSESTHRMLAEVAAECRALRLELADVKADGERLRARWSEVVESLARLVEGMARSLADMQASLRRGPEPHRADGRADSSDTP